MLRSDLFTGLVSSKIHVELNFIFITVTVTSGPSPSTIPEETVASEQEFRVQFPEKRLGFPIGARENYLN